MSTIPDDIMQAARDIPLLADLHRHLDEIGHTEIGQDIQSAIMVIMAQRQRTDDLIEECAKIAERCGRNNEDDYPGETWIAEVIAREIRALSDSTPTPLQEQNANGDAVVDGACENRGEH